MTFTVVLFVTRNPSLTTTEFKTHWETVHVPLLQAFSGKAFPPRFVRRYLARTNRKGFGSPANPDNPPLVLRGIPDEFDYDGIAEMTFESEPAFQEFYKAIYQKEAAATLAADEAKFLDTSKTKAVVVDETRSTYTTTGTMVQ